ncbi:MAG TPA: LPXTG cell wall anchor domain-containing protein [Dehalococcoidia bacterium]|nr:LPXTG cell wall anchor domain-containing protein [Dehalococcoidia bacterium]
MTGQSQWAIYGGLALLLGIGLVVFANRRRSAPPRT